MSSRSANSHSFIKFLDYHSWDQVSLELRMPTLAWILNSVYVIGKWEHETIPLIKVFLISNYFLDSNSASNSSYNYNPAIIGA
ncbi:hypothetical protein SAMN06265375_103130 [Muriicola jejuensis]|nr:hypothetical protein SAMN06265375_103130 [Muriicola jejuensis]